ncbi:MAG: tyrosine--tRNA ligase [Patescibacteria group bacterium]
MDKTKLIKDAITRSVDKIYPSASELEKVLSSGKKLRIYHGIDPTSPHLHLGHATNLLTLRKFQDLGHEIILLIGDFTARIGDPSGKFSTRRVLTEEEITDNFKTFKAQAGKILRFGGKNPVQIAFNSKWYDTMTFKDVIKLAQHVTVQQMLERDMFEERIKAGKPIGLHEFLYPIVQGYDSVALDTDMEIGGTDQTFNMLVGRELVKTYKHKEKFVLTTKLLINPKTEKKLMNKSEGGAINLDDEPNDMFGKVMAVNDAGIAPIAEFCTDTPIPKVARIKKGLSNGKSNPRDVKLEIAFEVVKLYHGEKSANGAREEWIRVFSKKETPDDVVELKVSKKISVVDLLLKAGIESKSEARRLIEQGGVKIGDKTKKDSSEILNLRGGEILKIGKRRFFRIS